MDEHCLPMAIVENQISAFVDHYNNRHLATRASSTRNATRRGLWIATSRQRLHHARKSSKN